MFCNSSTIYFYPKLISLIICCCSWSAGLLLPGNKHHRYPRWLGKISSVICTLSSAVSCQHRFISKNASKNINPGLYVTPFIITLWFYNSSVFCITEPFSEIHSLHHAARSSIVERSISPDCQKTTIFSVQHVVVFEQKIKFIKLKRFYFCLELGRQGLKLTSSYAWLFKNAESLFLTTTKKCIKNVN